MPTDLRFPAIACGLASLASCQHVITPSPTGATIHWSDSMLRAALYGPIIALTLGFLAFRLRRLRWMGLVLFLSGLVGAPIGAGLLVDKIVIDEHQITERHGFPWDRQTRGFAFEGLLRTEIKAPPQEYSASRGDIRCWTLTFADPQQNREIYPSSLWVRATAEICEELASRGIECSLAP